MSSPTTHRGYTIEEAAALTGLPASTLRYYEQDLDQLMWVACPAATGLSVSDMKQYVANGQLGLSAAGDQIELLAAQERRLPLEAEHLESPSTGPSPTSALLPSP